MDGWEEGKSDPWEEGALTPEELNAQCDSYFERCRAAQRLPTKPGLAVFLGISLETYDRWIKSGGRTYGRHGAVLRRAQDRMSDELQQRKDAMAVFLLKQPCYGGYHDKAGQYQEAGLHIRVTFGAAGGKRK